MLSSLIPHQGRTQILLTLILGLLVIGIVAFPTRSGAKLQVAPQTKPREKKLRRPFKPGVVLVRFRSESIAQNRSGSAMLPTREGVLVPMKIESFRGASLVEGLRVARVAAEDTSKALDALRSQPEVLYAEPDYIFHKEATPNDPCFPANNLAPCQSTGLYGLAKIGMPTAWNTTTGSSNVVIGVVDQGIFFGHEDLSANKFVNNFPGSIPGFTGDVNGYNFVDNNGTIFSGLTIEDHATHVAGIAGAVGNNNLGVVGVNWTTRLMSLRFLDEDGFGDTLDAIDACNYAKQMRDLWIATGQQKGANVRVLNASFGGGGFTQAFQDSITSLNGSGILVVAAAGNVDVATPEPDNDLVPHYPSSYEGPNVIAVAATDSTDSLSSFSHFGATSVDLGAPGSLILSTVPYDGTQTSKYKVFSGTSMATPHVAGAAALLWSQNPNLTPQKVKDLLLLNGDVAPSLVDKTLTGRRLNVATSLQSLTENDVTPPGAVTNLHIISQTGRTINVGWNASGDDGDFGQASLYQVTFTDLATNVVYSLKGVVPATPGSPQNTTVKLPYRRTSGTIIVHAFDNVGNEGTQASILATVPLDAGDPYVTSLGSPGGLSSGGTRIDINADDAYSDFLLPFNFPYFGHTFDSVTISTNGNLYFSTPPFKDDGTSAADVQSSAIDLSSFAMIAGLWDDLDLRDSVRADAGIYVTQSASSVIFRWQGKPCNDNGIACQGGSDVNFEIELRSDGTIKSRYGPGNVSMRPAAGISIGERDAYVIPTHTSQTPINLTNAQEVRYTPRSLSAQSIQFSQPNYGVSEGPGTNPTVTITVTRTGDTSGTATVNYTTADADNFTVGCGAITGNAFARCDFATSLDTLTFAPGDTIKTFKVPIINDALHEGDETFAVVLSNPTGAALGAQSTATVTIADDDTVTGPNPIFTTPFFVRQHYLDFLSREPEVGEPWSAVLNNCSDVNNNPACDRITVSGAFFGSPEFQLKGYFVYRFYKLAFNRLPLYTEIVADMRAVTGQTPAEVFQKKGAFTNAFAQRGEFVTAFGAVSDTNFVNTLMTRYNLTQITTPDPANPDGANKVNLTTQQLIDQLGALTLTRPQVLRAIADSDQVFTLEFNQAFVAMQYYGYLRRTPEPTGYNAWLTFLNANPNDSRTMVNGFMNSAEYRLRFGPSQ
jgi:subtilisin family serine protease